MKKLLILLLFLVSCGHDGKDETTPTPEPPKPKRVTSRTYLNCPKGTGLTYENFGEAFFLTHCTSCHSRALDADKRAGAPVRVNLERLEDIGRWRMVIRIVASDSRTARMPPKATINPEERKSLREWLDCGAPGEQESLKTPDQQ